MKISQILILFLLLFACQSEIVKSDAKRIQASIDYLASDELEGRGTATDAERKAAEYIVDHFKKAGLEAYKGKFRHPFDFSMQVKLGKENSLTINGKQFELLKNFAPIGYSLSKTIKNSAFAFLGYGLEKDYKKATVTNKVAVLVDGFPSKLDAHSKAAMGAKRRNKLRRARDKGASAVIILVDEVKPYLREQYINTDAGIAVLEVQKKAFYQTLGLSQSKIEKHFEKSTQYKIRNSAKLSLTTSIDRPKQKAFNIVAYKEGKIKDKYIVFGAHYDHLGMGFQSGGFGKQRGVVHNGADDNASGTAGLIELAYMLKNYNSNYSVLFLAFSGEELGLLGSRALVKAKLFDPKNIVTMINMDMIGRLDEKEKEFTLYGTKTATEFDTIIGQVRTAYEIKEKRVPYSPGNSDHHAFYEASRPVLFFNSGLHSDYHRPSDDSDKINSRGEAEIINFISDVYQKIDALPNEPTFQEVKEPNKKKVRPFNVYVGTNPDYAYQGKGLKLSGTSAGSPAEKAGMKKNDIMIGLAGKNVENIYDYMSVLGELKAGKSVKVKVKRDGKVIELDITPASKTKY